MKLKIKFYSLHREIVGKNEIYLEIDETKKLKDIIKLIFEIYPELKKLEKFTFVSLNHKYANGEEIVNEGDEIAIFPPVEGG
ncbi:MAG: MoaD/ThiS family protein [Thermoplasmatales archaeon]|nr:MoaD/ThiS family protein [Thermoplasmatales archaeon]